jgi:hypothetical protein
MEEEETTEDEFKIDDDAAVDADLDFAFDDNEDDNFDKDK